MKYRIPLTAGAQSFSVNLGGVQYRMTLVYRTAVGGGWFLDIVKNDETDSIYGLPLVLGVDLLAQHQYKNFGHIFVEMEGGRTDRPTFEDMGQYVNLLWSDGND